MNVDVYPFPTGFDMLAPLQSRTGAIQAQLSVLKWLQFKIGQNAHAGDCSRKFHILSLAS